MKFLLSILLFVSFAILVQSICDGVVFYTNPLKKGGTTYAQNPSDDTTGDNCNFGVQKVPLSTDAGYVLNFTFSGVFSLEESKATIQIYDGNDNIGTPFCEVTKNVVALNCPSSLTNQISLFYNIDPKLKTNLPSFSIVAKSIQGSSGVATTVSGPVVVTTTLQPQSTVQVDTTTAMQLEATTTAIVDTTTASPVNSITTTASPVDATATTLSPVDTTTAAQTTTVLPVDTTTVAQTTTVLSIDTTTQLQTTTAVPTVTIPQQPTLGPIFPLTTTTGIPTLPTGIVPDPQLAQGDIAIILDTSSNNALLQKVATEIINSLQINAAYTRVNIITLSDKAATFSGWSTTQANALTLIEATTLQAGYVSIRNKDFGVGFNGAFVQSIADRANVLRTAIFITDNNNQRIDQIINSAGPQYINNNDIHPVLVNTNPLAKASTFKIIGRAFDGDNTNAIIQYDYVSNKDLFESILLNANALCNLEYVISMSIGDTAFEFPYQGYLASVKTKNYCNYMKMNIKCASDDNGVSPITVSLNNYSLEDGKDFVYIYDDQSVLRAMFGGMGQAESTEQISHTQFVLFQVMTDNQNIYTGLDVNFTNCTIVA
uniref:CUB domain-containing protein n=1 Tax=Rhabditophanes sp. KR3021 TaxID=114890 RepID=A0AC35TNW2_9BILA